MNALMEFLVDHGLLLLCGVTGFLATGGLAIALQRSPPHRQRLGELTVGCALIWLALACVPLPRWTSARAFGAVPRVEAATVVRLPPEAMRLVREMTLGSLRANGSLNQPERPYIPRAVVPDVHLPDARRTRELAGIVAPLRTSEPTHLALPQWFAPLYLCGAGACIGWLLIGHVLLARLLRQARTPAPWVLELFDAIMSEAGARRARLLICPASRPMSFGILRPTVLIGRELVDPACAGRLHQVLRHELAHLARRDAWGNALFNCGFVLLYAHPLFWWVRSKTFLAREMVADDRAARQSGRVKYAADLMALARSCRAPRPGPLAVVGMFQFTPNLSRRILMLVQHCETLPMRCSRSWRVVWLTGSAAALAVACGALGIQPARAQSLPPVANNATDKAGDEAPPSADRPGAANAPENAVGDAPEGADRLPSAQNTTPEGKPSTDVLAQEQRVQDLRRQLEGAERKLQAVQRQLDASKPSDHNYATEKLKYLNELEEAQKALGAAAEQQRDLVAYALKSTYRQDVLADKAALARHPDALASTVHPGEVNVGGVDLVALANSYTDAVGSVRLAQARLGGISDTPPGTISHADIMNAKATYANAQGKVTLLRQIGEVCLKQAAVDLKRKKQLLQQHVIAPDEIENSRARVTILQLILSSGGSEDAPATKSPPNFNRNHFPDEPKEP